MSVSRLYFSSVYRLLPVFCLSIYQFGNTHKIAFCDFDWNGVEPRIKFGKMTSLLTLPIHDMESLHLFVSYFCSFTLLLI